MHRYFPHTGDDIARMLERCGVRDVADLYADVPQELRLKNAYQLPAGKSDTELRRFFNQIAALNIPTDTCFAGGGFYQHQVPAVIPQIASRSEFLTAYTPYQPEISQGTLQYIFEYQTMMTRLTGLDVSNASLYDGSTAAAEAMMMAVAAGRKKHGVLVSATVAPAVRDVVATYCRYHGIALDIIPEKEGVTDLEALDALLTGHDDVAGVLLPQPNYYGIVEDFSGVAEKIHARKALMAMHCVAGDLATLRTPGEWGADIACGDAQSLGIPLSFGGPYLGYICATKSLMRRLPGRIVGATTDAEGRRCFVLTIQAREQHIRREKATSNICSNQGMMTLWVDMYMALLGAEGLREVNERGAQMARRVLKELEATGAARLKYPGKPFLNEFAVELDYDAERFVLEALAEGILAGIALDEHTLLVACTEMQTADDAHRLGAALRRFVEKSKETNSVEKP